MPSFKSITLAIAAAFVATSSAQKFYDIEPQSVDKGLRMRWCEDQKRSCPFICSQTDDRAPLVNDCDYEVLRYGCICGDGQKPNMTEYTLTLPYHMCQEWGTQCVEKCGLGANQCAGDCREQNPCGALDPQRVNATSSASSTPEPTASSTDSAEDGIFTGMDGASGDEDDLDSPPSAAAGLEASRAMGFAILVGGVFGGFALAL